MNQGKLETLNQKTQIEKTKREEILNISTRVFNLWGLRLLVFPCHISLTM
jgi:hypothetical protein